MCSSITQHRTEKPCYKVGEGINPNIQPRAEKYDVIGGSLASYTLAVHQGPLRGWWECLTWVHGRECRMTSSLKSDLAWSQM